MGRNQSKVQGDRRARPRPQQVRPLARGWGREGGKAGTEKAKLGPTSECGHGLGQVQGRTPQQPPRKGERGMSQQPGAGLPGAALRSPGPGSERHAEGCAHGWSLAKRAWRKDTRIKGRRCWL